MADSLGNYLEAADDSSKLLVHARLLGRVAEIYQQIAPPHLGQASTLANFKSGIMVVHASSGAVATKLRQMTPRLVDEMLQRGIECRGLEVKVRALDARPAPRLAAQKPLSVRTSQALSALSESLPVSPLRGALEKLLARAPREE
ncbi:DUF721 domain-containing protein [Candidatus Accumulibacter sp. ACC003]|uniref:DUF721 domain-containing protein n=1 Tax=Candidatus Accumulibacter sp. ACC003 TaxID=2823334 RepID=UPI0025B93626|nr:DUF721 domain-containing protein [Candidatus Accumulibacter sp. ACC003]